MRLDAHQHYWDPGRGDYGWMPESDPVLSRVYAPADLRPDLEAGKIDGTVLVQAAPTVEETDYLLEIADKNDNVRAVVGWVDFEDPSQLATLERLSKHPKFAGVRPMIQDIADPDWMLRADIGWAFEALIEMDLTFDLLGLPQHLPNARVLLERYPDLRCVLDHMMKPQIHLARSDKSVFRSWSEGMTRLAQTGAFCKLSGLVTEAAEDWTIEELRPFTDHVIDNFGADRVMWGSDWPVCRLRAEYDRWLQTAQALTQHLDEAQRHRIFGGTAAKFYNII